MGISKDDTSRARGIRGALGRGGLELLADFVSHWGVGKSQAAAPQPFGFLVLAVLQKCIGAEAFARFQGAERLYPLYFESVTRAV
jgi:hypothetical protein